MRSILIAIGLTAVVLGALNVAAFSDWVPGRSDQTAFDFNINWIAARRLADQEPLYDRAAARREALEVIGPEILNADTSTYSSYIGPPSTALTYLPFTVGDYDSARLAYRLVDFLGMVAAVILAAFALPRRARLPAALIGVGAVLFSQPVAESVVLGQVDYLVMLGLALGCWAMARKRWGLAGMGFGLATVLKVSPGLIIVYLLLRGQRRAAAAAALTMAAVLGLAAAVGRPVDLWTWTTDVAGKVTGGVFNYSNTSLPAWLARIFTSRDDLLSDFPLGSWRLVGLAVAVVGVGGLWWLRRTKPLVLLEVGALVLIGLLAGPLTWDHYMAWATIPLVLIADVRNWAGRTQREILVLMAALGTVVLLMRSLIVESGPEQVRAHQYLRLLSGARTIAVAILLAVTLWMLLRPAPAALESDAEEPLAKEQPSVPQGGAG